ERWRWSTEQNHVLVDNWTGGRSGREACMEHIHQLHSLTSRSHLLLILVTHLAVIRSRVLITVVTAIILPSTRWKHSTENGNEGGGTEKRTRSDHCRQRCTSDGGMDRTHPIHSTPPLLL